MALWRHAAVYDSEEDRTAAIGRCLTGLAIRVRKKSESRKRFVNCAPLVELEGTIRFAPAMLGKT